MAIIKTDDQHYKDIAKAIRGNTSDRTYKPSEMAEAIYAMPTQQYEAGKAEGLAIGTEQGIEQGKQAEYDRFWDAYQNSGGYVFSYAGAFGSSRWTDEVYNPKYPIVKNGAYDMERLFWSSAITDTKVPITASSADFLSQMFNSAAKLKTIRKLVLGRTEGVRVGGCFDNCIALENITIEGVLCGQSGRTDPNFQWSPLTVESMKNIISCLKDYSGTESEYTCTVKFSDECWAALDAEGNTAPGDISWKSYVDSIGWLW